MKLMPDFKTDTRSRPLNERLHMAIVSLCQFLVPLEGDGGLKLVARDMCRASQQNVAAAFGESQATQALARIKGREARTAQTHTAAMSRQEHAEAELLKALAADDEILVRTARKAVEAAVGEVGSLAREMELISDLRSQAEANCRRERESLEKRLRREFLSDLRARVSSAREKLLEALQRPDLAESIGEFSLGSYILSLESVPGEDLADVVAAEQMPESRRGVPAMGPAHSVSQSEPWSSAHLVPFGSHDAPRRI